MPSDKSLQDCLGYSEEECRDCEVAIYLKNMEGHECKDEVY